MDANSKKGFTLIEVLIVLALMGFISTLAVQKFSNKDTIRSSLREIAITLKKTRSYAKLKGQTYRLVLKMSDTEAASFWVESSAQRHLIDPKDDERYKVSLSKDKDKEKNNSPFQVASEILSAPKTLAKDWIFSSVETSGHPEAITSGEAYVYFFPEGLSEEAVLQLTKKGKSYWSVHINPVVGPPDLYEEAKSLKDFKQ